MSGAKRRGVRTGACRVGALTGYGQARDRERSREAGFDAHLVKPLSLATLTGTLEELMTQERD